MEALAAGSRHLEIVLLHEINAGTFARLYLAEARAPGGIDRIVAVKILREQWNESEDILARTRDEARLLARLRHKNILKVEELAEIDGQPAIIMEFVDGLDLKQLVEALNQKRQRIPAKAALQIAQASASALEAAHFRIPYGLDRPLKVVHRDVKPSNIMVSAEGEVKVLDFGTARSSHALRSAQTGALRFGSLKYMSPERREGDRGEHPADVYALALVLIELLRGEWLPLLPMDLREHDDAVAHLIGRLDNLGMPNREWDTTLRQVLGQMLAGDPATRPNAEQVVKLMRAFADQAGGAGIDGFAADIVAPLTREIRGGMTGGAMAGTRFVVNVFNSDPASREGGRTPEPVRAVEPRAVEAPKPIEGPRPTEPPRRFEPPRPEGARPAPATWHADAAAEEPAEAEERPSRGGGWMIAVGAGAFALVGIFALLTLAGAGWWWWSSSRAIAPEAPPPRDAAAIMAEAVESPPVETTGPTPEGAPLAITVAGAAVQWIKLETVLGQLVAEGKDSLSAQVPPDTYVLALKVVGRPIVRGSLRVPGGGATLECSPDRDASVRCGGVRPALVLKPD